MKLIKNNKFNLILTVSIIFCLQSWTWADDIRDFQIEGMSVGDSALDYFSKKKITNNLTKNYKDNEFIEAEIEVDSDKYDVVQIRFKKTDNK